MTARTLYRLNLVLLLVYFGAAAAVWPTLPDRIPTHFGAAGAPDAWADTSFLSWFGLPVLAAGMAVGLWWLARLSHRHPSLWSVPDQARFLQLSDAQRMPIVASLETFVAGVAIIVTVLFAEIQVEMYAVAMGRTTGLSGWFWLALLAVVGGSTAGAVALYVRLGRRIREAAEAAGE